jgi:predicted MPP superfamily phosphohydrolase
MPANLRIAITADLHWSHRRAGDEATEFLASFLHRQPPDVLILAGDLGTVDHFRACLALFADLPCRKALVPGNHDIWVEPNDARGDSLQLYQQHLPAVAAEHGFQYLDQGPLLLKDHDLALVGSINWYDYSWSLERLRREVPDWEHRLRHKQFSRGRHNDARFVRWPLDDVGFTAQVVGALERHLQQALDQVGRAIVVTHHPACYGLSFPRLLPPATLDGLLWDALSGNTALEAVLVRHADRVPLVFSGHTHRACECRLRGIHGFNVGGDYHFKRLLLLDWPAGEVQAHTFGDPSLRRG